MATAANATASPARKIEGPQHYQGLSTDRRPRFMGDTNQPVGPGSTFLALDTGQVDRFDGTAWRTIPPESAAVIALLHEVLDEQRATREAVEQLTLVLA